MSTIGTSPINSTTPSITTPGSATSSTPKAKNAVDQQTFMTLLVAQLKNQDPLNPQDGAQFVAQLAQFNSLDQLISINGRLGQVLGAKPADATTGGSATAATTTQTPSLASILQ